MENPNKALKVLVSGDVRGRFKAFYERVQLVIEKKGQFDYLFCVGNFFGSENNEWSDVVAGEIKVPVTTYVLGPNKPEHVRYFPEASGELGPNVIYLGKQGIFTGHTGLNVAYLSGVEQGRNNYGFCKKAVDELIANASKVHIDILLTSQWPAEITKYVKPLKETLSIKFESKLISDLIAVLKPRYCFAGFRSLYYERIPYRNHLVLHDATTHLTRFIGLAPFGNAEKQKSCYAFEIEPCIILKSGEVIRPAIGSTSLKIGQYFFAMYSEDSYKKRPSDGDEYMERAKRLISSGTSDFCWFCLKHTSFQKHLLITVGKHCYVTLAKGSLVPDHVLIVPINHIQASVYMPKPVEDELEMYKAAFVNYFHDQGKDVVFFERNCATTHLQVQVIPFPKGLGSCVKESLFDLANLHEIQLKMLSHYSHIRQVVIPRKPYFYFESIVDRNPNVKVLCMIELTFPLQFGRMVLASKTVLNLPDRIDWKECKDPVETEQKWADEFKKNFKPYEIFPKKERL